MRSTRPRKTGLRRRIQTSSTTTSSRRVPTSRLGSSRSCSSRRCVQRSNRCANQAETDGPQGARVPRTLLLPSLRRFFSDWRHPMARAGSTEDIDRQRGSLGAAAIGTVGSGSASTPPSHVSAAPAVVAVFETLKVRKESAVLFADIAAPPMNLLGPALVRDLVSLIHQAEADSDLKVLVFRSADPDYFIPHVDVTRIQQYREEAAKLTGEASIALMFRHLSASRLVTIAQIEGRVRAAGSEFVLACDTRSAARESAIFSQFGPV